MKSKDWFLVGVRLLGVWLLVGCLGEVISFAQVQWGLITLKATAPTAYLLHAAADALGAMALIWGAPWLTDKLDWHPAGDGTCAHCGYDLRGGHVRCPECGQPAPAEISHAVGGTPADH